MLSELRSRSPAGAKHHCMRFAAAGDGHAAWAERTNRAECRFSLMKRAVYGAHHSVSEAHLPRYLAEWDFKWNTRKMKDGERAARALKGAEGKRLTYRQPR
jgi:hypothetical protein